MNTRNFKYIYSSTFDTYEKCYKKTKSNFYFSKEYKKKQFKIISIILNCIKKKETNPSILQTAFSVFNFFNFID